MELEVQQKLNLTNDPIVLTSSVQYDEITDEIAKKFDYEWGGVSTEIIELPTFPADFGIGVIVGSSGSGKSTIMRKEFGEEERIEWDNTKSIASNFGSFEEASNKLGAVGLNSIPTWLKPYNVLSNGEKFRADMARRLHSNSAIDEFTSVVNREVAISCSVSIAKYIRNNGLHNIVFCSCHDDILPFLQPDWIYNTDTHTFYNGRYLRRPQISIDIQPCSCEAWDMFKRYHYLSGEINKAAACYLAKINNRPIAFAAVLALPGKGFSHAFKEHRLVVLPDYQGMGIGNRFSEAIAQGYLEKGCKYFSKTANPRMGDHRNKSTLWRGTSHNGEARTDYLRILKQQKNARMSDQLIIKHADRVCYAHEYIGNGTKYPYTLYEEAADIGEQLSLFD